MSTNQSLARASFTLVMLGIAGTTALVLGIIGIYGVISYVVASASKVRRLSFDPIATLLTDAETRSPATVGR
jgi:formate hydrogenlyase subunit 3/multisubunit Na+/H+ antiporter MnhD subunit